MQKKVGGGVRSGSWGQVGCEPRIKVIVKKNRESGGVGSGEGVWGMGDVNQELKVLFNVHKGIVQY